MKELPDDSSLSPEPIRCWKQVILPYPGRKLKRRQTNNQPRRIEQKMEESAREYVETHDEEIPYEVYKLARELEKL